MAVQQITFLATYNNCRPGDVLKSSKLRFRILRILGSERYAVEIIGPWYSSFNGKTGTLSTHNNEEFPRVYRGYTLGNKL